MVDQVKDGYYATLPDSTQAAHFLRISRPTKGQYKDTLKIQTQHGPRWNNALIWHPSRDYRGSKLDSWWEIITPDTLGDLLLIISDQRSCLKRYSKLLDRCNQCNTELTDWRSRWYGIGPDCEKAHPEVIEEIDDDNDGHSFEWLRSRGMIEEE